MLEEVILLNKSFCLLLLWLMPFLVYGTEFETHVKSDSGDLNYKTGVGTYIGHVTIIRGPAQLEANKAITYLDKNRKLQKAMAFGNPAHLWQKAAGQDPEFHAYAQQIEFYPNQNLLILIGNGKIVHENNTLQAPYITYNIQSQTLTTQPSKIERTTIIIRKSK